MLLFIYVHASIRTLYTNHSLPVQQEYNIRKVHNNTWEGGNQGYDRKSSTKTKYDSQDETVFRAVNQHRVHTANCIHVLSGCSHVA